MSDLMYRARLRECPGCTGLMRQVSLRAPRSQAAVVDLCDRCGGVFLEFFDGEPSAVARELKGHLRHFERAPFRVGGDPLACPDCRRTMEVHPYLEDGPSIARCNRCMAVFATTEQIRALSSFHIFQDAPSWFQRLIAILRSIFDL